MKIYSYQKTGENHAKAFGVALPVSTKHSIEICRAIRNKKLEKAREMLLQTINLKKPIAFKRFKYNVGHKKGDFAAGRYPVKACSAILQILDSAEKNALAKGLSVKDLVVVSIIANRGPGDLRFGRFRGRKAKKTHIQIVLEEKKEAKKEGKKELTKKHDVSEKENASEKKSHVKKTEIKKQEKKPDIEVKK